MAGGVDAPVRNKFDSRFAITFGEVAILHVGGQEIGQGIREHGFSVTELEAIAEKVQKAGGQCELVRLTDVLPAELRAGSDAATLVVRDGAGLLLGISSGADDLFAEQLSVRYDMKYYDTRQRKTKNKRARFNVVFGDDGQEHSSDYSQCTVQAFHAVPTLRRLRQQLAAWLGEKAAGLCAEGNHYYDSQSGIGFHGDSERKIVICLSLGRSSLLRYHWRMPGSSEHELPPVDIELRHGDVYIMSEKATGFDWRLRSRVRVVHAAGSAKYTGNADGVQVLKRPSASGGDALAPPASRRRAAE